MRRFQIHGKKQTHGGRTIRWRCCTLKNYTQFLFFYFSYRKKGFNSAEERKKYWGEKKKHSNTLSAMNKRKNCVRYSVLLIWWLFANEFGFHSVSVAHLHSPLLAAFCRRFCAQPSVWDRQSPQFSSALLHILHGYVSFIVIFVGRFVFIRRRSRVRARSHSLSQFHFHFASLSRRPCARALLFFFRQYVKIKFTCMIMWIEVK